MAVNQSEKEKLYQWACEYNTEEMAENCFTRIDKKRESYFEKKSQQEQYCKEYTYQTIPEMGRELDELWKDDEIMKQIEKTVLAASIKGKPRKTEKNISKEGGRLPPFIYNF